MTKLCDQNAALVESVKAANAPLIHHYIMLMLMAKSWIKQLESTATLHMWTEAVG